MNELPETCDLRGLGLDPARITRVERIHQKWGGCLYRVEHRGKSYVLKWFGEPDQAVEVCGYALLEAHGVPTLTVHGRTEDALLLEDLASSPRWRLATEADIERAETGVAVAAWYRALHEAGRRMLADPETVPEFLVRQEDAVDPATVLEIGQKLGLADNPVWALAADHVEAIKRAMRSLPETLNYNDFHWTNLALSRNRGEQLGAIVFDYHLLGIGLVYSDCRNVAGSLGGDARSAFWDSYGPVDEREVILDEAICELYALSVAVNRPRLPDWAKQGLDTVRSGGMERSLRRAIEMIT